MKNLHKINSNIIIPAAYRAFAEFFLGEAEYIWITSLQKMKVSSSKDGTEGQFVHEQVKTDIKHYTVKDRLQYYIDNPFALPENLKVPHEEFTQDK